MLRGHHQDLWLGLHWRGYRMDLVWPWLLVVLYVCRLGCDLLRFGLVAVVEMVFCFVGVVIIHVGFVSACRVVTRVRLRVVLVLVPVRLRRWGHREMVDVILHGL